MPNRAQRRKKQQPASLPKSQEVMLQRLMKNGITIRFREPFDRIEQKE